MLVPFSVAKTIGSHAAKESTWYAINGYKLERKAIDMRKRYEIYKEQRAAGETAQHSFNRAKGETLPKCRALATDGRRLLVASWVDNQDNYPPIDGIDHATHVPGFNTILPVESLPSAVKGAGKIGKSLADRLGFVALDESSANGKVNLATTNMDTSAKSTVTSVEGNFPNCDRVIPALDDPTQPVIATFGINPVFLLEACKALAEMCCNDESKGIRVTVFGPDTPIRLDARNPNTGVEATCVIVPVNLK